MVFFTLDILTPDVCSDMPNDMYGHLNLRRGTYLGVSTTTLSRVLLSPDIGNFFIVAVFLCIFSLCLKLL